jgi:hypothetical protein
MGMFLPDKQLTKLKKKQRKLFLFHIDGRKEGGLPISKSTTTCKHIEQLEKQTSRKIILRNLETQEHYF